jgi:hypothetical protein
MNFDDDVSTDFSSESMPVLDAGIAGGEAGGGSAVG